MAASYPSSVKSFTTKVDGAGNTISASHVNDLQAEVTAMEGGLINGVAHTIRPTTDNTYDSGDSTHSWRDLFLTRNLTHLGFAGVGAILKSNASKQIVEQALTNGQVMIGSTAAAPVAATITGGSGISVTNAAGSITIATTAGLILLKEGSGTDTGAGAVNVDAYAMASGLTAKDSLLIEFVCESVTQATAGIGIYNSTDAVTLQSALGSLAAGAVYQSTIKVTPRQGSLVAISSLVRGTDTTPTAHDEIKLTTFSTNWTGAWTIALRHTGVTAGGTFKYEWKVYRMCGQ